jgi:hypothetical protein
MERIVLCPISSVVLEGIMGRFHSWKTSAPIAAIASLVGVGLLHWPTITIVMVAVIFTGYTIIDELLVLATATRGANIERMAGDPAGRGVPVPARRPGVGRAHRRVDSDPGTRDLTVRGRHTPPSAGSRQPLRS